MGDLTFTGQLGQLEALAERSLSQRAAYFGPILRLATAPDAAIRAAAVRALAGVRGVPGLRALVGALADSDAAVRAAAVEALRMTARDAPVRFAHALFHREPEIRRAALTGELVTRTAEIAIYLRGDPACADLARALPWPSGKLSLAFELYAMGTMDGAELATHVAATDANELRTFLDGERGRHVDVIATYLAACARATVLAPPPGYDVYDTLIAIADEPLLHVIARNGATAGGFRGPRALAALLGALARGDARPGLLGAAAALHPELLGHAWLPPARVPEAAAGLARHQWPVRRAIDAMLKLPRVIDAGDGLPDLAAAAAIAGALPALRLRAIEIALGQEAIAAALVARDDGWDTILELPAEDPPFELGWLAQVGLRSEPRMIALAGRAIGKWTDKRLDALLGSLGIAIEPALVAALVAVGDAPEDRVAVVAATLVLYIPRGGLARTITALFGAAAPPHAQRLVRALVRAAEDVVVAVAAAALDDDTALALIALFDGHDVPPRSREIAVASEYQAHRVPAIRAWSHRVLHGTTDPVMLPRPPVARRALTAAETRAIGMCSVDDLTITLEPALDAPLTGVVAALAVRGSAPSVWACTALFGSGDPLDEVARELDRHAGSSPKFAGALDDCTAENWMYARDVSPLVHARLWRWEAHTAELARWVRRVGGMFAALQIADALPGWLARATLWRGIAEHVVLVRYRERALLDHEKTAEMAVYCVERIDHPIGREAARIAVALVESGVVPAAHVRDKVLERIADTDDDTRSLLTRIVRFAGLPAAPKPRAAAPEQDALAAVRACSDLDQLVAWCSDARPEIVHEAVLALLLAGAEGEARLAALLARLAELPSPLPVLASVAMWESAPALAAARALAAADDLPPAWLFHLGLALVSRGERALLPRVFAAACKPSESWFRREDWTALVRVADTYNCALALATSPHHHAYRPAIARLLEVDGRDAFDALLAFLDAPGERPLHLRRAAALRVIPRGYPTALPVVFEHTADARADDWATAAKAVPNELHAAARTLALDAALIGGDSACTEKRMLALFAEWTAVPPAEVTASWGRILDEASTKAARSAAAMYAVTAREARDRLGRVAEVFAWGVRRAVELTGKLFTVHMTSSEKDLGHTYLGKGTRIFVSPLPMLRDEEHGQDVVEGLILHELGHHVYHKSEEAQALWKRAHQEGIGHLLNLIADEHLERNLRAVDPAYGDRLKRLDAYAFQHAAQEISLANLFSNLRGSSARALIATELGVAFDEAAVRLRRGAILGELAKAGHPLARFARALRMGLGNRERDPLIEQALALCGGKELRHHDMAQLYAITQQLAAMFGGATACAQVFGGPEGLGFGERDDDVFSGLSDEALQKEVERVLDPRTRSAKGMTGKPGGRLWINVAPDNEFKKITRVERLRADPALHAALAAVVRRHAMRLHAYLDDLGLVWTPVKARTAGRALDRSRLRALVTRGDPRILIAREPVRRTDLFLGVIVDCSGSMTSGGNLERAKKFAVLVAEACRGVPGVEARMFGFTDTVIYDAGDARDCAVTSLASSGGNNDSAALYHAAGVAAASNRRAKILVMISDGLPTECSVQSLRALVIELSRRRGIVCAQVAVRELDEICFPNYVLLDDANPDVSVARFGQMIAKLAGKALGA